MKTRLPKTILRKNDDKRTIEIIQSAIEHIKNAQQPSGNFLSLSSPSATDFSQAITYSTTFFTSNILSCLHSVIGLAPIGILLPEITIDLHTIICRGGEFLLGQKSEQWSFNYFTRGEKAHAGRFYPDDLDDTFAALIALARYKPDLISGDVVAAAANLLIDSETEEGGPYRTWIVPQNTQMISNGPDIVVNSTIGYFLSLFKVDSPRIAAYLSDAMRHKKISSIYYPGTIQASYFISRYLGTDHTTLPRVEILNPLECAMSISSCFHYRHPGKVKSRMARHLIDMIHECGWQPYPFCIDPAQDHKTFYAGSSALTAAFTVEALARCLWYPQNVDSAITLHDAPPNSSFHRKIREAAEDKCIALPKMMRIAVIEKIKGAANAMITAPSYDLKEILAQKGSVVPEGAAEAAALASLYGWLAYDMYDDFFDGEGDPSLLSPANYFSRKLTQTHTTIAARFPTFPLGKLFDTLMNKMGEANMWEISHCRITAAEKLRLPETLPPYDDYGNLADRSIGYAAGPLAELILAGYSFDSTEYRATESLFRHYLIARQLHDDAHDWETDLMRGSVNSIGALLIDKYRIQFPEHAHATVAEIIHPLREFFWKEIIDCAVGLIQCHIREARCMRDSCELLNGTDFMENALLKLERGAAKALTERDSALEFLTHF